MAKKIVWIIVGLALLPLTPVFASKKINTEYYSVRGNTSDELLHYMHRKGPRGHAAYTKWDINTNYRWDSDRNSCWLTSSEVRLKVAYSLPKWKDKAGANPTLQKQWDTWFAILLAHEKTHGSHGESAQQEIEREFTNLSSKENCQQLEQSLDSITQQAISRYASADRAYDRETNHGATEGLSAVFPEPTTPPTRKPKYWWLLALVGLLGLKKLLA